MAVRFFKKALVVVVVVLILGPILWTWGALVYVYSRGERAGYVQKFSKKGWMIKTWEGEIAMVNLPGAMPEIFSFSVRKDDVAREIQNLLGQRVTITYDEHKGLPGTIFGETQYFVTEIRRVGDAPTSDLQPVRG